MLERIDVAAKPLEPYKAIIGLEAVEQLKDLAGRLRGKRLAHINATSFGGGVSELLRSLVPLYRTLGVQADWLVIPGSPRFFEVTKDFHNALQGADFDLTDEVKDIYLKHNQRIADLLDRHYDYVIVHDPQPAPLARLHGGDGARWIWRCHIDTSEPNEEVFDFLRPFLADYDALVFTMREFMPQELRSQRHSIMSPAIDPLNPKNMAAPADLCRQIIQWAGVELERPYISQISRFDPWKDPLGVIEVYRRVRDAMPGTQLALLGQMALDDPEGWKMYADILADVKDDPDIHVLTNFTGMGNMEVNAFQRCASVVLQKSLREGFGLVVTEALWKGTPVVAGRAGGIPMQIPDGVGGYLIDSVDECVERTVELLRDPEKARELGASGRDHVREHFLITRLAADELKLLSSFD